MIFGCFCVVGLCIALELGGLQWRRYFEPKHESVNRQVFKETRSFNEGKRQELVKYRLEYLRSEGKERKAVASTIRMAFADYDDTKLSPELRAFLQKIMRGQD